MCGQRDPLRLWSHGADMGDEVTRIELDLDLVLGLANLHPPPNPGNRNGVANGVHGHVSFYVHRAWMQPINGGNPRRQWLEMRALDREQFARHGADMFLVGRVDAVAPLPRLLIQIVPTGKPAARQKVVFDKGEGTLDPRRAVGVAALMRHKVESEAFRERLHFGY